MSDHPSVPIPIDELIARGLYDPDAPGAEQRLLLVGRVMRRGGTIEDLAANTDLELLASRLQLRSTSARYTFRQVAERALRRR